MGNTALSGIRSYWRAPKLPEEIREEEIIHKEEEEEELIHNEEEEEEIILIFLKHLLLENDVYFLNGMREIDLYEDAQCEQLPLAEEMLMGTEQLCLVHKTLTERILTRKETEQLLLREVERNERILTRKEFAKYLDLPVLQPRRNETGGKASKVRDDGSMDGFDFLAKRKKLPKTDVKKSKKKLWLEYFQAESPGESKTLLSKPLYEKRSEAENFINYSSTPAEHCTSADKHNAIIPDNDRLLCKVCYMNELSIVFLPCSHMVACRRCAARLKTCPVCRSGIKEALPANLHE